MGEDLLIKIAIDMGIETPGFIPCVPTFRNDLKQRCPSAIGTFEKAFKCVETDPSTAIGLANSALESIIKRILSDDRITAKWKDTETLHKLTDVLLREFKLHPSDSIPEEVRNISSSLLTIARQIEKLRSEKSEFHGKTPEGEIITDPTYAYLCINSVSTVGSFLLSYYTEHYPEPAALSPDNEDDDLPF
ncbi:MAG: abortive infection family protein [Prevotella sp.]|nr:abortive infection family protein [Prevotella sp.]